MVHRNCSSFVIIAQAPHQVIILHGLRRMKTSSEKINFTSQMFSMDMMNGPKINNCHFVLSSADIQLPQFKIVCKFGIH